MRIAGRGHVGSQAYYVLEGDTISLPAVSDRHFLGWTVAPAAADPVLYNGAYTVSSSDANGAIIDFEPVYADTIEVILGGVSQGRFMAGETVSLPAVADRDDGAPFLGWSVSIGDYQSSGVYTGSYTVVESDFDYGVYTMEFTQVYGAAPTPEVTYTVTAGDLEVTATAGTVVYLPSLPDTDDKLFMGWQVSGQSQYYAGVYTVNAADAVDGRITLTAYYTDAPTPTPSGDGSGNDTVLVAMVVFVILLQVLLAFGVLRK